MVLYENEEIRKRIIEKGKLIEKGTSNKFSKNDLKTLIGTLVAFEVNKYWIETSYRDLGFRKYRYFDWLAMQIGGRNIGYPGEEINDRKKAVILTKIFSDVYLFDSIRMEYLDEYGTFDLVQYYRHADIMPAFDDINHLSKLEIKDGYAVIIMPEYKLYKIDYRNRKGRYETIQKQVWIFAIPK